MRNMSQTVMTHLETIRALSEREQNNQMVAGLGDFVRNAPDSHTKGNAEHEALAATNMSLNNRNGDWDVSRKVVHKILKALVDHTKTHSPMPEVPDTAQDGYFDKQVVEYQQSPQLLEVFTPLPVEPLSPSEVPNEKAPQSPRPQRSKQRTIRELSEAVNKPLISQDTQDSDSAGTEQSTYQRAAALMCQSLA